MKLRGANKFTICCSIVGLILVCANSFAGINDGLVAYYPFNGNANDTSGYENNGTVFGATLTFDRNNNLNSAYSFDGDNDYIQVSDSNSLYLLQPLQYLHGSK